LAQDVERSVHTSFKLKGSLQTSIFKTRKKAQAICVFFLYLDISIWNKIITFAVLTSRSNTVGEISSLLEFVLENLASKKAGKTKKLVPQWRQAFLL
jgi:hypothetical protein